MTKCPGKISQTSNAFFSKTKTSQHLWDPSLERGSQNTQILKIWPGVPLWGRINPFEKPSPRSEPEVCKSTSIHVCVCVCVCWVCIWSRWHRVYFVYNVLSCQCEGQVTETGCIFGTKSPNLGKREFWTKIGQRSFSPLMVPYLHAKNQKNPRTSFRDIASLTNWLTD